MSDMLDEIVIPMKHTSTNHGTANMMTTTTTTTRHNHQQTKVESTLYYPNTDGRYDPSPRSVHNTHAHTNPPHEYTHKTPYGHSFDDGLSPTVLDSLYAVPGGQRQAPKPHHHHYQHPTATYAPPPAKPIRNPSHGWCPNQNIATEPMLQQQDRDYTTNQMQNTQTFQFDNSHLVNNLTNSTTASTISTSGTYNNTQSSAYHAFGRHPPTPNTEPQIPSMALPLVDDGKKEDHAYYTPQVEDSRMSTFTSTASHGTTTSGMESIMQPSAKTILERRARAMAEGRRQDAKLTEGERRIVRRLRNRESAERCRLRRVEQGRLLERKMVTMKQENDRLVGQVEEYQTTVSQLEQIIHEYLGKRSEAM